MKRTAKDRFLANCDGWWRNGNGCWIWQGSMRSGFRMGGAGTPPTQARRAAWLIFKGPIGREMAAVGLGCHEKCVRPEHLRAMPQRELASFLSRTGRMPRKLTPAQVLAIRAAPRAYGSGVALAARYAVSQMTISNVRSGNVYKYIEAR